MIVSCDFRSVALALRQAIEPGLDRNASGSVVSAGSCLHASILLAETLGRFYMARVVIRGGSGEHCQGARDSKGRWHGHYWVEAMSLGGEDHQVIDITADQFGHEAVRVLPMSHATDYRPGDQAEVDASVQAVRQDLGLI